MSLEPIQIGEEIILKGERKRFFLDAANLFDYTQLKIPIEVIRGKKDGPTLFISAAIHGDEINGVEIIKRLLARKDIRKIKGTLILIPVVNVYGFNNKSRYLPDRRDLNRCFPGSSKGSLAARLAHVFMNEIVKHCSHGIDLHTGALHRTNLPQIRACLDDPQTKELAQGFGVPVVLHSELRDGSLREAARDNNVISLLFEGGEALRFEENVIKAGLRGCVSVMKKIGMLSTKLKEEAQKKVYIAKNSYWVRAAHSGSFRTFKNIGDRVEDDELLATISDPFGGNPHEVRSKDGGIVIGQSTIPLVNNGDAIFHIATFKDSLKVEKAIDHYEDLDLVDG